MEGLENTFSFDFENYTKGALTEFIQNFKILNFTLCTALLIHFEI